MNSDYFKLRFEAVFLHLHAKGPKLSIPATARYLKKSEGFVEKSGSTTSRQDNRIVQLFEQNPGMTVSQGVERLSRRGIHVSKTTVRRRLAAAAVRYRPIKKPLLTPLQVEKRLRWATENLTTDWSKVIFRHR